MTRDPLPATPRHRIAKAQGRSVNEWIGKSPDEVPPRHVQLRVFRRFDGRCHITKRKIRAGESWQCDHVVEVEDGGENRESNLAPALTPEHAKKTAENRKRRAKADAVAAKHIGIEGKSKRGGFRGWRKFNGDIVWKDRELSKTYCRQPI